VANEASASFRRQPATVGVIINPQMSV